MSDQRKIILFPNADRDVGYRLTTKVRDMLAKCGRSTCVCVNSDDYPSLGDISPDFEPAWLDDELSQAEMIITFGGDGTILKAARAAADAGVPILGINLGNKGFMAELEADDIEFIYEAGKGNYKIETRMMLDVEVQREEEVIYRDFALNDVVVRGDHKVIDLMLFGDGQGISHFSGDGTVIATPTGSTAYSMSAGGPIVEEAAHNIILTPICAHMLQAKSFVLESDRRVSVLLGNRQNNPVYMSVDGGEQQRILSGDKINVYKSERCTRLVRLSNRSFYKKVSEKLGEKP